MKLVISEFLHLKSKGQSPQEAFELAVRNGLGELTAICMLRSVYDLTFDEAVRIKDGCNL